MPEHPADWIKRVRGQAPMRVYEDPWGDDGFADASSSVQETGQSNLMEAVDYPALATASLAAPHLKQQNVPSLQSMCLGLFAKFLEDLLEAGPEAAEVLSLAEKAALLAVARRRRLLNDEMLAFLSDEDFTHLDVSHSLVTSAGLCRVLPRLPRLQHLSLFGIEADKQLLLALSDACPQLVTLRMGGFPRHLQKAVDKTFLGLFQSSDEAEGSTGVSDDWENSSPSNGNLRLMDLQYLIWLDAEPSRLQSLREARPKLVVNPAQKCFVHVLRAMRLPQEANFWRPLDVEDAAGVSQFDWQALTGAQNADGKVTPARRRGGESIAERFRAAYRERAQRQALKAEKNRKQAWRRYVREQPTEMLIRSAEAGMPLQKTIK